MNRSLIAAYDHERQGRLLQAIDAYDEALEAGPIPKLALLRLLFLYALLADDGFAWGHGVTSEAIRRYEGNLERRMAQAIWATDSDPEVLASILLIRQVFLNEAPPGDIEVEIERLESTHLAPSASLLRWFISGSTNWPGSGAATLYAFIESLEGDESQRAQYIRQVLHVNDR